MGGEARRRDTLQGREKGIQSEPGKSFQAVVAKAREELCWDIQKSGFFFFVCLLRAAPAAYGGSQARGPIRAVVASLHQSHSNARSELHL